MLFSLCVHFSLYSAQIIYLNGTSSVGKTTIAKALQEGLAEPYLRIGIDQVIQMMPDKINNWEGGAAPLGFSWKQSRDAQGHQLQLLQAGPFAQKMAGALREIVQALANNGFNVIVDDVALDQGASAAWKQTLKDHDVLWVGLTAPLEIIEQREKQRGDRQLGQARAAFAQVHQGFIYDHSFDTHAFATSEIVAKIKQSLAKHQAAAKITNQGLRPILPHIFPERTLRLEELHGEHVGRRHENPQGTNATP
jgi:chloramphenicol 3-O phosphotransferase